MQNPVQQLRAGELVRRRLRSLARRGFSRISRHEDCAAADGCELLVWNEQHVRIAVVKVVNREQPRLGTTLTGPSVDGAAVAVSGNDVMHVLNICPPIRAVTVGGSRTR